MVTFGKSVRNRLSVSGMGALMPPQPQAQVGMQYQTSQGVLKAELLSAGLLQASFEGFQPLPIMQVNTQLAFVQHGLAMGALQSVLMTLAASFSVYEPRATILSKSSPPVTSSITNCIFFGSSKIS